MVHRALQSAYAVFGQHAKNRHLVNTRANIYHGITSKTVRNGAVHDVDDAVLLSVHALTELVTSRAIWHQRWHRPPPQPRLTSRRHHSSVRRRRRRRPDR